MSLVNKLSCKNAYNLTPSTFTVTAYMQNMHFLIILCRIEFDGIYAQYGKAYAIMQKAYYPNSSYKHVSYIHN